MTIDGTNDTLVLGVRDDQNIGTQVILAVGLPNGYGFGVLAHWTQNQVFLNTMPTMLPDHTYGSHSLYVNYSGVYAHRAGGQDVQIAAF